MGATISRLYLDIRHFRRRRSQQDETAHGYPLNKNYFCNYFFMGGERFEVNDPNYLFGDNCDLNFLTCTKPYSMPYKKAQQNLLSNLSIKQKAINKVSSRMSSLSSPLHILTGRHRQVSQSHKQDAQTQTLNNTKGITAGPEPSQPLVMLINIRKETLRLIKTSNIHNIDNDQNSPTNAVSLSNVTPTKMGMKKSVNQGLDRDQVLSTKAHPTVSSKSRKVLKNSKVQDCLDAGRSIETNGSAHYSRIQRDSDSSSLTSVSSSVHSTITSKSGYTSVRDVPPSECASDDNDDCYQDALNEPSSLSAIGLNEEEQSFGTQQNVSNPNKSSPKDGYDIRITIDSETELRNNQSKQQSIIHQSKASDKNHSDTTKTTTGSDIYAKSAHLETGPTANRKGISEVRSAAPDQIYNIEFMFDSEVDCSIKIFYFCTRDVTSTNVSYEPQHATYKSKTFTYKKGLNQKFEQHEHTFQPYLFDEDLLIYKPLDSEGNYNSGAVFPIVIHCAALEGSNPKQSQSLVATVEKSQLDDSYSIKPLKQLLFVDGVQYILQDIYGIENKPLLSSRDQRRSSMRNRLNRTFRSSCGSLYSTSNLGSNLNLSDTASIESGNGNRYRSFNSENSFECVICMSDERDTLLLPCRHLCLCSSCAQSLRYQASSCPICRCPFKAALNLRVIQSDHHLQACSWSASQTTIEGQTQL